MTKKLSDTDKQLSEIYKRIFNKVIDKVKRFGGIKEDESLISIISTLEGRNILKNNTTVAYQCEDKQLPEEYNGLGYMNLINIIFEIEYMIDKFKKITIENPSISDINLFFIEEPEAHTHPQMQYIFSQNIKESLKESTQDENGNKILNLQTIISTHSPHIASKSDFNDYKYFYRRNNIVISKNVSELEKLYGKKDADKKAFSFIKQYITLNRAELFFADKAILIEGDTERILLSAMMRKVDKDIEDERQQLLSQNISIVEVGNYSHVFEKFIDFIGIKTLVITDFDTSKEEVKKDENGEILRNADGTEKKESSICKVVDANKTTNTSINFFFKEVSFSELPTLDFEKKIFIKNSEGKWVNNTEGNLCVAYQTKQGDYHGRSFEDAFIGVKKNLDFIKGNIEDFNSMKNKSKIDEYDAFGIAEKCIDKKTGFAIDILYNSSETGDSWDVPDYIREGLKWIAK